MRPIKKKPNAAATFKTAAFNAGVVTSSPKNNNTHIIVRSEQIQLVNYPAGAPSLMLDFYVNPTNEAMFPWLSGIANSWDLYEFVSLTVQYVPDCSVAASGSVTAAFDYDVTDLNPNLTQEVLSSFAGAVQGVVYQPLVLPYVPASTVLPAHKYYTGPPYDNLLRTPAHLYLMFSGVTNTTSPGRLWVHYTVRLTNPQSNTGIGTPNMMTIRPAAGSTVALPFGTPTNATVTGTKPGASNQELIQATRVVVNNLVVRTISAITTAIASYFSAEVNSSTFHNPNTGAVRAVDVNLPLIVVHGPPGTHVGVEAQISGNLTVPAGESQHAWPLVVTTDSDTHSDIPDQSFSDNPGAMPDYYNAYGGSGTAHVFPPWEAGVVDTTFRIDVRYRNIYLIGPRGFSLFQFSMFNITDGVTISDPNRESYVNFSIMPDVDGRND